jgi:hypothetical protein
MCRKHVLVRYQLRALLLTSGAQNSTRPRTIGPPRGPRGSSPVHSTAQIASDRRSVEVLEMLTFRTKLPPTPGWGIGAPIHKGERFRRQRDDESVRRGSVRGKLTEHKGYPQLYRKVSLQTSANSVSTLGGLRGGGLPNGCQTPPFVFHPSTVACLKHAAINERFIYMPIVNEDGKAKRKSRSEWKIYL